MAARHEEKGGCYDKKYNQVLSCVAKDYRTRTSGWPKEPRFRRHGQELVSKPPSVVADFIREKLRGLLPYNDADPWNNVRRLQH